jgi:hypothetical protein
VAGSDRGKGQGAAAEVAAAERGQEGISKEAAAEACVEQELEETKLVIATAGAAAGGGTEMCGVKGARAEATLAGVETIECATLAAAVQTVLDEGGVGEATAAAVAVAAAAVSAVQVRKIGAGRGMGGAPSTLVAGASMNASVLHESLIKANFPRETRTPSRTEGISLRARAVSMTWLQLG